MKSKRKFTGAFKSKVAFEAIRERETLSALSSKHELSVQQISKWEQEFLEKSELIFTLEKAEKEIQKLRVRLSEICMLRMIF